MIYKTIWYSIKFKRNIFIRIEKEWLENAKSSTTDGYSSYLSFFPKSHVYTIIYYLILLMEIAFEIFTNECYKNQKS
jgi:hypothetical protein